MELAIIQAVVSGVLALFPSVPAGVVAFIGQLVTQLPSLVNAGTNIVTFLEEQFKAVKSMIAENRDPTQAEWDALNATVAAELSKLDAAAKESPSV